MLRKIWERAVNGYQSVCQQLDSDRIGALDHKIKEAREGFETRVWVGPMGHGTAIQKIELSPERAQEIIRQAEEDRAAIIRAMDARREKYGLKP